LNSRGSIFGKTKRRLHRSGNRVSVYHVSALKEVIDIFGLREQNIAIFEMQDLNAKKVVEMT